MGREIIFKTKKKFFQIPKSNLNGLNVLIDIQMLQLLNMLIVIGARVCGANAVVEGCFLKRFDVFTQHADELVIAGHRAIVHAILMERI